jgi:hypothetical protein
MADIAVHVTPVCCADNETRHLVRSKGCEAVVAVGVCASDPDTPTRVLMAVSCCAVLLLTR